MGMFDTVKGVLDPYDDQFKCWEQLLYTYEVGDRVGRVGIAETYSIRINAPEDVPPRFVWVKDEILGATMAHQPIEGKPVFDKWGGYLGFGGEPLVQSKSSMKNASQKVREPVAEEEENCLPRRLDTLPPLPPPEDEGPTQAVTFDEELKEKERFGEYTTASNSLVVDWVTHSFWIRPGVQVKIHLPENLTQREAERLALFVESLPFLGDTD